MDSGTDFEGAATPSQTRPQCDATSPVASIIMANYNGGRYIAAALHSALRQVQRAIEIIVCDDGSTDDSMQLVSAIARDDKRVRQLPAPANGGPAAARNRGLELARGTWIAVMDSDDLMHPARMQRLIDRAEHDGADIVADDLVIFADDARIPPRTCLRPRGSLAARLRAGVLGGQRAAPGGPEQPFWVDAADYVRANTLFRGGQALGYLKPLFRADLIRDTGIRYDTTLRIAEDFDFVLRLLAGGARFRIDPWPGYFYRKHAGSISHRLSRATLEPMLAAHDRQQARSGGPDRRLDHAMAERRASLLRALAFDDLVGAMKRRDWRSALALAIRRPDVTALLRQPVIDRLQRQRARRRETPVAGPRQVCVLSRQRIIGNSNGSSVYLLGLCNSLHHLGYQVHLLGPAPSVFGRWPVLRLRPETRIFHSIQIRRALHIGRWLVATDPVTWRRAGVGILGRLASRLGIAAPGLNQPAPYSISQPWTREDCLFVARHGRDIADVVIADYAFQTAGIAYVLRPDALSLVIMHDLFSSRTAQFSGLGARDSVATLDRSEEMRLLGQADIIVAIQPAEAAAVRASLPDHQVIVAPVAVDPVAEPQPGSGHSLLFVGSNTAPNVDGLRWFVEAVWPDVRASVPDARLDVAGTVCGTLTPVPDGVRLMGSVRDLAACYRDAAVVISPLRAGSGLKIKLIEALGFGKAIVATPVTLQGVEDSAGGVVAVADAAPDFAAAIITLLTDERLRMARATAALELAREQYSAAACHAGLLQLLSARENP